MMKKKWLNMPSSLKSFNNSLEILQPNNLVKDLQLKVKKVLREMLLLMRKFFLKMAQEKFYLQNLLLQTYQKDKEF